MTHANIDDLCRVYAARILELEKQLGECSRLIAGILGAAEVDRLDIKSNEWRSYMIEARHILGLP